MQKNLHKQCTKLYSEQLIHTYIHCTNLYVYLYSVKLIDIFMGSLYLYSSQTYRYIYTLAKTYIYINTGRTFIHIFS